MRGLWATYAVHRRLIRKRLVDFLLVLIELILLLRLRRYERKSAEDRRFRRNGVSLAQNFRYQGSSPYNHPSCQKTE